MNMRFLANENFPWDAVHALRKAGHDVIWVRTDAPGSNDQQILRWAQADNRILITFDKDFGELAFRSRLPSACGIVLFRISMPSSERVAEIVVAVFGKDVEWAGHFAVVDDRKIRITPLP